MGLGLSDLLYLTPLAPAKAAYDAYNWVTEPGEKKDQAVQEQKDLIANRPEYQQPGQIDEIISSLKARQNEKYNLPTSNIPEWNLPDSNIPEFNLSSKMPGYDRMIGNIYGSTAGAVRNVKEASNSVAGTLGAITTAYGNQNKAIGQVDIEGEKYAADIAKQKLSYDINKENTLYDRAGQKLQYDVNRENTQYGRDVNNENTLYTRNRANQDSYLQGLQLGADYSDKAWNWNVGQKYGEQYNYLTNQQQNAQADQNSRYQFAGDLFKGATNLAGSLIGAGAGGGE